MQRGLVNALHVALGQRPVVPAFLTGMNCGLLDRDGTRPHGAAGIAATAAAAQILYDGHESSFCA
jgi:hypothetical protein